MFQRGGIPVSLFKIVGLSLRGNYDITVLKYADFKETSNSFMFDGKRLNKKKLDVIEIEVCSSRFVKGFIYTTKEEDIEYFSKTLHYEITKTMMNYKNEVEDTIKSVSDWNGELKHRIVQ